MELITDPLVFGLIGKIVGGVVLFLLAIGFIPGLIIGWILASIMR